MGIKYLSAATDHWRPGGTPAVNEVESGTRRATLGALAIGAWGGALGLPPQLRMPAPKPLRKCALPGCEKMATRDYCSAEHCAEHRRLDRERRGV